MQVTESYKNLSKSSISCAIESRSKNLSKYRSRHASDSRSKNLSKFCSSYTSERVVLEICQSLVVVMQVTESY